ncbi:MAG: ABC transporter permease, partial [Spirochaetales bacterium]|nr:ABC transporter permease [Spirochaetales bacterium]
LLLLAFSINLRWFPAVGTGDKGNILDQLYHLILPAVAMSISWIGYIQRIVRETLAETLSSEYVKTAKSFGIPRNRIIYKYCLRNAIKPLVNIIVIGWGAMLGGSFIIESIFGRRGLGRLVLGALQAREYYAAQCGIMIAVVIFISAVILADIVNAIADPRIRLS